MPARYELVRTEAVLPWSAGDDVGGGRTMMSVVIALSLPSFAADYTADGVDDLVVGVPYEADIAGVALPGAIQVFRGNVSGLTSTGDAFIHQNTAGVPNSNAQADYFGIALGAGDVDGDGLDDVIVGGPSEGVGGVAAGTVWRLELSASANAMTVVGSQAFSQDSPGVSDVAEQYDGFARAIAVDDFDGDGFDDVVVGIPGEDVGAIADAGAIQLLRGGAGGLTTSGQRFLHQDSTDVNGGAEAGDRFGTVLASGDFDGDGFADLAVGAPDEDWTGTDEGAVHVIYGSATGFSLVSPDDELWSAGQGGAAGVLDDGNGCGAALAVANFDGDAYDDLAVGCPGDDSPGATEAGSVLVIYGSSGGLSASEVWHQDSVGITGNAEVDDRFGEALAAGDYDGNGYADLAIGVPFEDFALVDDGVVQVLLGSSAGLTEGGDLVLSQDAGGIVFGSPASNDYFGWSLTSGDYDSDGRDDLVVGSPFDADSGASDAGVVNVFPGSVSGPSTTFDQFFHQDILGVDDSAEAFDGFGWSLR
jgi:hypothetical protein